MGPGVPQNPVEYALSLKIEIVKCKLTENVAQFINFALSPSNQGKQYGQIRRDIIPNSKCANQQNVIIIVIYSHMEYNQLYLDCGFEDINIPEVTFRAFHNFIHIVLEQRDYDKVISGRASIVLKYSFWSKGLYFLNVYFKIQILVRKLQIS